MAEYVDIISMNLNDPTLRPNDGGYQSVEPGTYDFEIEKTATATSQAGNNTLKVTARVVGPEDSAMLNRRITNTFVISQTEYHRSRMLGFVTGVNAPIDQNGNFSRDALVGLRFTADVEKRPGKGIDKMGNEVEREYTSWVRERAIEGEEAPPPPPKAAAPDRTRRAPATGTQGRPQAPR